VTSACIQKDYLLVSLLPLRLSLLYCPEVKRVVNSFNRRFECLFENDNCCKSTNFVNTVGKPSSANPTESHFEVWQAK
jgi:hypothetical protein